MNNNTQLEIQRNREYIELLSLISQLSRLFSESQVPFLHYRAIENIFCRSFNATNLSRSDTAFDAKYNSIGIGLKTFISKGNKLEKVAEFNSLSNYFTNFKEKQLAIELAKKRNERIDLANRIYNIENSIYHIVARDFNELQLFETDYSYIDINKLKIIKNNSTSLLFSDDLHEYSYNYSKSTLFRRFITPLNAFKVPVEIIDDPFETLIKLFSDTSLFTKTEQLLVAGKHFVILPLYGIKEGAKFVYPRSSLNQWNARGRERNLGEVYLQIPSAVRTKFSDFFPPRDKYFNLKVPTGEVLQAKVCQDNSKALMTNPNKALADWLLRKVLHLKEGERATIEKLDALGFDSVIIEKKSESEYTIDILKTDSYENFAEIYLRR